MHRIGVASKNPVKAESIHQAYRELFPDEQFEVVSADVESGVPDQPFSDDETRRGARNRLEAVRQQLPDCDSWAALEGGIQRDDNGMVGLAWIVVQQGQLRGEARTATFPLPPRMAHLIEQGVELGKACDMLYDKENCKHQEGAIGLLSHNVIDRTELYRHAAVMALLPLRNPHWFAPDQAISRP